MPDPAAAIHLRAKAEALGAALPPLLAQAERLVAQVPFGDHGRRRPGAGREFWQFRPAEAGDAWARIDWRRSARSDMAFVREHEAQSAQTITLWLPRGQSMEFASQAHLPTKAARGQLLALSLALLLLRGGERVGLWGAGLPPRAGRFQAGALAEALCAPPAPEDAPPPPPEDLPSQSRLVILTDALGPMPPLQSALEGAAARGQRPLLLQILDPAEAAFPYRGRIEFASMAGALRFETQKAESLAARYRENLAARQDALDRLIRRAGGLWQGHRTDQPALSALLWLYRALAAGGRA